MIIMLPCPCPYLAAGAMVRSRSSNRCIGSCPLCRMLVFSPDEFPGTWCIPYLALSASWVKITTYKRETASIAVESTPPSGNRLDAVPTFYITAARLLQHGIWQSHVLVSSYSHFLCSSLDKDGCFIRICRLVEPTCFIDKFVVFERRACSRVHLLHHTLLKIEIAAY